MEIGIFAKVFERPTLEETLDAVVAHGIRYVQFNMQCAGLPSMPDEIPAALITRIREAMDSRDLVMDALSGTFNMAHPDPAVRETGLQRLEVLAAAADGLGAHMITLCTGTRDPDNMWRFHPDNASPEAWGDCWDSLSGAMAIIYEQGPLLGIEPEPGNVVSDARKARQMLYEVGSDQVGVILDPANIIAGVPEDHIEATLGEALAEIGHRIISVHGKDRDAAGKVVPAGQGIVPWEFFIPGLWRVGYHGSIILHGLEEAEIPAAVAFMRGQVETE